MDNLKLGYGGTKAEMERLLEDAEKLSGIHYDISNYADIIEAIHVIQTEMGITGTTAKEASETIEGSANAAKAAWQNLLTGFGRNDADLDKLVDEVIDSVTTLGKNVLPVAERAFTSLMKTATREGAKLAKQIPGFIDEATEHIHQTIADEFGATSDQIFAVETAVKAAAAGFVAYKAALVATDVVEGVVTLTKVIQGATTAQEALNAAGMANPYVLLATAIATATVALKAHIDTQLDLMDTSSEFFTEYRLGQQDFIDSSNDLTKSINDSVNAAKQSITSVDEEAGSLHTMADELYEINEAENLTNEQKAKMKSLVDSLNGALPALNLELDEETGHLKNQKDTIDALIDSYQKQARAQAAQEQLVELYKEQYKAEKNVKDINDKIAETEDKRAEAVQKVADAQNKLNEYLESEEHFNNINSPKDENRIEALREAIEDAEYEVKGFDDTLTDLTGQTLVPAQEALMGYNEEIEGLSRLEAEAGGANDLLSDSTERTTTAMSAQQKTAKALANDLKDYVVSVGGDTYNISEATLEEIRAISDGYAEALQAQENNIRGSLDLFSEFNGGAETSSQQLIDNLWNNAAELENWAANIQQLANWGINEGLLKELEEAGPASANKVQAMIDMGEPKLKQYSEKWEETQGKIHEIAEQQTEDQKQEAERAIGNILGVYDNKKADVEKASTDIGQMMVTGLGDEVEQGTNDYVVPVTAEMVHKMNTAAQTALNEANFNEKGDNIPHGLAIGIENGEHWAIDAMHKMIHDVQDTYMQDTDSRSPSKLFRKLAGYIPQGMAEGIDEEKGLVVDAMNGLVGDVVDAMVVDPSKAKFVLPDASKLVVDENNRRFKFKEENEYSTFSPSSKSENSYSTFSPSERETESASRSYNRSYSSGYDGYYGYSISRPLEINLILSNGLEFARYIAPYLDLTQGEVVTLKARGAAQ